MTTFSDVQSKTNEFFGFHWPSYWGQVPQWSSRWDLCRDHPNHNLSGCYLLLDSHDELIYIGKAARFIKGALARRLLGHVVRPVTGNPSYEINRERWPTVDAIRTLAFRDGQEHLAVSLEAYLIRHCSSERNRQGKVPVPPKQT